ncbi:winged helix DNA-binding domain-containing protein [Fimbriimonas ginsengisoli]|uniref:Winged helix DNA-binding domain-containing protein n=1 Tax=Fimbriimonas ginsengisoli Gsoil 348 TaxID=661478 RepID=A0A068NRY0_FIMGI|nr:winged helix DNA-binding domain-containing protein [Fimbriimonas ginsengisoli]AIE85515.1 hypothetical protein OP10G_2147 [Fimbriimonas ginsengisoli Gsoil 348]
MIITQDQARRLILGQQGLIVAFAQPLEAVRAMVAVQTQYAASLPVAVAARLRKGRPGWEDDALSVGGSLVKSWSVRNTLHAHLPEDHRLILGTMGDHAYRRYLKWARDYHGLEVDRLEAEMIAALSNGPLSREQLHDHVPIFRGLPGIGWGLDVMGLALKRRVCIVGRGSEQCFALLEPGEAPRNLGGLLRRYLEAFGPATLSDFYRWSGLSAAESKLALNEAGDLERLTVEGMKGERLALPGQLDAIPEGSLGVKLLAKFDPLILAHRDKTLFLPEKHHRHVFRIAGQVEAVVLSDGIACATWRLIRKGKKASIAIDPIRPLKPRESGRLAKEAASLVKKLGLVFDGLST